MTTDAAASARDGTVDGTVRPLLDAGRSQADGNDGGAEAEVSGDAARPDAMGIDGRDGAPVPPPSPLPADSGLAQMLRSSVVGLGYYYACAIKPSRDVQCFGQETSPDVRDNPPAGLKAVQVVGNHNGFCAVDQGGAIRCWGSGARFVPPPRALTSPLLLDMGFTWGCALRQDRSVSCWGDPALGAASTPPSGLTKAKALSVAAFFACAITEDDSVVCWGHKPPAPPSGLKARSVAATVHGIAKPDDPDAANGATRHACAIKLDGMVECWGDLNDGQDPPAGTMARDIAVASRRTCIVAPDGKARCWGRPYNNFPPCTASLRTRCDQPMPDGLMLKAIRSRMGTFCGVKPDDTLACWGFNAHTAHTVSVPTGFNLAASQGS